MNKLSHRWAVFISGRGSNLQAMLDSSEQIDIRCVVSSKETAAGLAKARKFGVPQIVLPAKIDWTELNQDLKTRKITHIMLAGFMKIVPESFIQQWEGKILNIHPSLLPQFPGLNAFEKSFLAKVEMGISLHQVIPEMDAGPLCYQKSISKNKMQNWKDLGEASLRGTLCELQLMREVVLRWN